MALFLDTGFNRMLKDVLGDLYRIAYAWSRDASTASDLVQQTAEKALKNKSGLKDKQAFKSWIITILYRNWMDHCRRNRELPVLDEHIEDMQIAGPEEISERINKVVRIRDAVSGLKSQHREVIVLVSLQGLTYAQVARILDIPIGTVMSRLCRARNILKEKLADLMESPENAPSHVRRNK